VTNHRQTDPSAYKVSATEAHAREHTHTRTHTYLQPALCRRPLFVHKNIDVAKWYAGGH